MAYEIHIRRLDQAGNRLPISLAEWHAAIDRVAGIRKAMSDTVIQNPATGEVIRIPNAGGDAEVFDEQQNIWNRAMYWSRSGHVSFRAPPGFEQPTHQLRKNVRDLARALGAVVIGDEGETYP